MPTQEKREQEEKPLLSIGDSFKKIIIVEKNIVPKNDENRISIIDLKDFLLNTESLDF
ncbi:MAG: hypothetical protein K6C34_01405 [Alphaproteobacteria bacterium]|nr:hypothetical protein [Alphaproteobacteria bacterium]